MINKRPPFELCEFNSPTEQPHAYETVKSIPNGTFFKDCQSNVYEKDKSGLVTVRKHGANPGSCSPTGEPYEGNPELIASRRSPLTLCDNPSPPAVKTYDKVADIPAETTFKDNQGNVYRKRSDGKAEVEFLAEPPGAGCGSVGQIYSINGSLGGGRGEIRFFCIECRLPLEICESPAKTKTYDKVADLPVGCKFKDKQNNVYKKHSNNEVEVLEKNPQYGDCCGSSAKYYSPNSGKIMQFRCIDGRRPLTIVENNPPAKTFDKVEDIPNGTTFKDNRNNVYKKRDDSKVEVEKIVGGGCSYNPGQLYSITGTGSDYGFDHIDSRRPLTVVE